MKNAEIVIIGTGSLATRVASALSFCNETIRVAIIGRSGAKASRIAHLSNARAAMFDSPVRFDPIAISQFNASAFSRAFRSLKPKVIFQAASLQSPWEAAQGPSAWTKLVAASGFGVTLPLQLVLAAEVSRAAGDSDAAIVNASYPDAVNVVLHRLGFRTTSGIGNSSIIEAFCLSHPKVNSDDVRVVGHHGHFGPWTKGKRARSLPRVWVNDREVNSFELSPKLGSVHDEMNDVTASTAVSIMLALLTGRTLERSIPGVAGLRGGYPYHLRRGKFTLRLPSRLALSDAIAHNRAGEHLDGIDLESGVKFVGPARRALRSAGFEYAEGFAEAEWTTVRDKMLRLRDRLRHLI